MYQESISILFYLNKSKINQKGVCPIYCRITVLKGRKQFSTGHFVNPSNWNSKRQFVGLKEPNGEYINAELSFIKEGIEKTFLTLQLQGLEINAQNIIDKHFKKEVKKEDKVVNFYRGYLRTISKLIGKGLREVTVSKYTYVCDDIESFIKSKFKSSDIPLKDLTANFILDFEYYLKTVKNQKQVTINKEIQRFRKVINTSVGEGYLDKDPFTAHKPRKVLKEVVFLSTEELEKLEKHQFTQPRLQLVKDLFIFCCYTGLAYNEMSNLKREHIIKGFDGNQWIQMKREKTDKLISVPVLPKAAEILEKYHLQSNDFALPKFSNQKINSYLKEIAGIVGINKLITHHMARKTFASTVLLYNDVPMEIVSELLGHSSMKITQDYYGKIVQKKVGLEMEKLKGKLPKK